MAYQTLRSGLLLALLALTAGCGDDNPTGPQSTDIDYPAVYVVNGGSNSISVIDLSTNAVARTIPLSGVSWPHHLNLNSARTKMALGVPGSDLSAGHGGHSAGRGRVVVLDAVAGEVLSEKETPAPNHNALFSPDDREIWTTQIEAEGKVLVYDAGTLALLATIPVGSMPSEVTFSADGSMAFVANTGSHTVTVIGAADKTVMATIPVGRGPVGAWTGANGKMYVDGEEEKVISVIDVNTMAVEETIPLGFTPGYAAYNASVNELWVSDSDSGAAVYFQRQGNEWTKGGSIPTGKGAHAIAFTRDGKRAYLTNQLAGTVSVIDVAAKAKLKDVAVGDKPNGIAIRD